MPHSIRNGAQMSRVLAQVLSQGFQSEGLEAVGNSFQGLGRSTGEEILKNPEINNQLKGILRYVDLNKLVTTFLTPDIWNKLGSIRSK